MDEINHPSHYVEGREIEPIDVIEDWGFGFHLGNALKYMSRAGRKDTEATIKDLRKAIWYLERYVRFGAIEPDPVVTAEPAKIDSRDALLAGVGDRVRVKRYHGNTPCGLIPGETYTVKGYGDFGRDRVWRLLQLEEISGDWAHTRFEVVA